LFLAVEGPQVKGVLLTIPPSFFMAARLLLRGAGVKEILLWKSSEWPITRADDFGHAL
jgi:hypothetical protein